MNKSSSSRSWWWSVWVVMNSNGSIVIGGAKAKWILRGCLSFRFTSNNHVWKRINHRIDFDGASWPNVWPVGRPYPTRIAFLPWVDSFSSDESSVWDDPPPIHLVCGWLVVFAKSCHPTKKMMYLWGPKRDYLRRNWIGPPNLRNKIDETPPEGAAALDGPTTHRGRCWFLLVTKLDVHSSLRSFPWPNSCS